MATKKITLKGCDVKKVSVRSGKTDIFAIQNKPAEAICPVCGSPVYKMRITRARTYQDAPTIYNQHTEIHLKRIEAHCANCDEAFTVPCEIIKPNSRMTWQLDNTIRLLLNSPYSLPKTTIAEMSHSSARTVGRIEKEMKKGV